MALGLLRGIFGALDLHSVREGATILPEAMMTYKGCITFLRLTESEVCKETLDAMAVVEPCLEVCDDVLEDAKL